MKKKHIASRPLDRFDSLDRVRGVKQQFESKAKIVKRKRVIERESSSDDNNNNAARNRSHCLYKTKAGVKRARGELNEP